MNDENITPEKTKQLEAKVAKMMAQLGADDDEKEKSFEINKPQYGEDASTSKNMLEPRGQNNRVPPTERGGALRRKKRPTADEEEEHKRQAQELIARMKDADENDREANRNKRPAIKKLIILEEIAKELRRLPIQYFFLDYNGCSVLANWLEPLPDGTYPNNRIVSEILQLVDGLQIDAEFLASSKNLGRIVKVYANNQANQPKEVALAKSIMDKWGRMVFGISTTYKETGQGAGGEDPEEMDEYYEEEAAGRSGLDKYKRFKKRLTKMQEEQALEISEEEEGEEELSKDEIKRRRQEKIKRKLKDGQGNAAAQITKGREGIVMPQRNAFDFVEQPRIMNVDGGMAHQSKGQEKLRKVMNSIKRLSRVNFTNKNFQTVKAD